MHACVWICMHACTQSTCIYADIYPSYYIVLAVVTDVEKTPAKTTSINIPSRANIFSCSNTRHEIENSEVMLRS